MRYVREARVLTRHERSKLQAAEMKYMRRVKGVARMDKVRNEIIGKSLFPYHKKKITRVAGIII